MAALDETDSNVEFVTRSACAWDGSASGSGSGGGGSCASGGNATGGIGEDANLSWIVVGQLVATATTCAARARRLPRPATRLITGSAAPKDLHAPQPSHPLSSTNCSLSPPPRVPPLRSYTVERSTGFALAAALLNAPLLAVAHRIKRLDDAIESAVEALRSAHMDLLERPLYISPASAQAPAATTAELVAHSALLNKMNAVANFWESQSLGVRVFLPVLGGVNVTLASLVSLAAVTLPTLLLRAVRLKEGLRATGRVLQGRLGRRGSAALSWQDAARRALQRRRQDSVAEGGGGDQQAAMAARVVSAFKSAPSRPRSALQAGGGGGGGEAAAASPPAGEAGGLNVKNPAPPPPPATQKPGAAPSPPNPAPAAASAGQTGMKQPARAEAASSHQEEDPASDKAEEGDTRQPDSSLVQAPPAQSKPEPEPGAPAEAPAAPSLPTAPQVSEAQQSPPPAGRGAPAAGGGLQQPRAPSATDSMSFFALPPLPVQQPPQQGSPLPPLATQQPPPGTPTLAPAFGLAPPGAVASGVGGWLDQQVWGPVGTSSGSGAGLAFAAGPPPPQQAHWPLGGSAGGGATQPGPPPPAPAQPGRDANAALSLLLRQSLHIGVRQAGEAGPAAPSAGQQLPGGSPISRSHVRQLVQAHAERAAVAAAAGSPEKPGGDARGPPPGFSRGHAGGSSGSSSAPAAAQAPGLPAAGVTGEAGGKGRSSRRRQNPQQHQQGAGEQQATTSRHGSNDHHTANSSSGGGKPTAAERPAQPLPARGAAVMTNGGNSTRGHHHQKPRVAFME